MIKEKQMTASSGWPVLLVLVPLIPLDLVAIITALQRSNFLLGAMLCPLIPVLVLTLVGGLFIVNPNQGRVVLLFGRYVGTVKEPGLRWANPFLTKRKISLRVRNFETGHSKVNDTDGNPIEIASVVVWKVVEADHHGQ